MGSKQQVGAWFQGLIENDLAHFDDLTIKESLKRGNRADRNRLERSESQIPKIGSIIPLLHDFTLS
ncbi:MAG: hypothetical protein WCP35_08490 [Verrucomicrobiota bacterium]